MKGLNPKDKHLLIRYEHMQKHSRQW